MVQPLGNPEENESISARDAELQAELKREAELMDQLLREAEQQSRLNRGAELQERLKLEAERARRKISGLEEQTEPEFIPLRGRQRVLMTITCFVMAIAALSLSIVAQPLMVPSLATSIAVSTFAARMFGAALVGLGAVRALHAYVDSDDNPVAAIPGMLLAIAGCIMIYEGMSVVRAATAAI